jgi:hypothetical protein
LVLILLQVSIKITIVSNLGFTTCSTYYIPQFWADLYIDRKYIDLNCPYLEAVTVSDWGNVGLSLIKAGSGLANIIKQD